MTAPVPLDRLVRKEVSLGAIRQKQPPMEHIGTAQIAAFLDVNSDDAIFEYIQGGLQEGLAPARAEDAEAELAQKDELSFGLGRASVIDWSLKDKYSPSDVSRYREDLLIQQRLAGAGIDLGQLAWNGQFAADFQKRVARDDTSRRRKLDNRIEWLIMQSLQLGLVSYNDGKIKWSVDWGRPANQTDEAPTSGLYTGTTHDPIGDFLDVSDFMYDTYGVRPKRVIASRRLLNTFWKSDRWLARTGMVVGGTPSAPIDPNYLVGAIGQANRDLAITAVQDATGIQIIEYDAVYQTRPIGSKVVTNNRFLRDDTFIFLPSQGVENTGVLGPIDDTEVGFAKTLTSPHPEGNWTPSYYEWEKETRDPWIYSRGNGIKAFPVFPYMELTYTMKAL